jgi:hypothetical protein
VGIPGFPTVASSVVNYLQAVGIRVKMRPMERAAFYAAWREKKLRGLFLTAGATRATRRAASRRGQLCSTSPPLRILRLWTYLGLASSFSISAWNLANGWAPRRAATAVIFSLLGSVSPTKNVGVPRTPARSPSARA